MTDGGLCTTAHVGHLYLRLANTGRTGIARSLQLPLRPTVVSASLSAPPREDDLAVSGVGPEGVAIPELGVGPLADSGTELEDELPTPEDSPFMSTSGPEGVCLPGVRHALPDVLDLELQKMLLDVSVLPLMVTPIVDPVVGLPDAPCSYPVPPLCCRATRTLCRGCLHSGRWPTVRSWMFFHRTSSRLLAPSMSQ